MKFLKLSLFCLLFATIQGEEKSSPNDGPDLAEDDDKITSSAGKRWTQESQSYQPQTMYSIFPSRNVQTEEKVQERAKDEKTFKDFIGYDSIQSVLINALKPKPIVDTAEESEKLAPNDGSTAQVFGDLVVKGTETISRALNSVIDGPRKAINKLSAGATEALNQLGAYLIGL